MPEPLTTPADPMTALAESAGSMHELFAGYVAAGFTEGQALRLIAEIMAAMQRQQTDD